jgi:quercetin dioxygenase-like cupin family protein
MGLVRGVRRLVRAMNKIKQTIIASAAVLTAVATWGLHGLRAEPPAFKRVELQKQELSVAGREAVMVRGEFQPGAGTPKHTHPGEELSYVLAGEVSIEIEDKAPQTLKTGDVFFVPAGKVHAAKNIGKTEALILSTYIVEKGKPLATPVTK